MTMRRAYFGIVIAAQFAATFGIAPRAIASPDLVFAQLSPEQAAQCQQEAAQLNAELAACTTDECRQNVQAAIAAHNQRCQ